MISPRKKRLITKGIAGLVGLVLLGGTGFVLAMKIKFADFQPPMMAANVLVTKVAPVRFEDSIDAVGNAASNESASLTATVTETVKSVQVEEGTLVTAGTLLVELSADEEKATLDEATRSYMRYNELARKNMGSTADRDQALAAMQVAQAQLDTRRITAPFDGIVGLREVSVGDLVTPGTLITTIDDIDPVKLDFSVPETFLPSIAKDMDVKARAEAYPDRVFTGKIYTIDPRVDSDTRAVRIRALIPNDDSALRPGMLLKVEVVRKAYDALAVPEESLQSAGEEKTVFVVGADNKIEERKVKTGLREPGYVEIVSGLKEGEKVVIEGQMKTGAGAEVKIVGEKTIDQVMQDALGYAVDRKKDAIVKDRKESGAGQE